MSDFELTENELYALIPLLDDKASALNNKGGEELDFYFNLLNKIVVELNRRIDRRNTND